MRRALLFVARAPLARVYGGPAWARRTLKAAFWLTITVLPLLAIVLREPAFFWPAGVWGALIVWGAGVED